MNFKCRCGHSLAANPNPGKTQSVTCSCSLTFNVDCTDGGTFIVSRAVVGERQESNAAPKRKLRKVLKPGRIEPLQNVDGCEYIVNPKPGGGLSFDDLRRLQNSVAQYAKDQFQPITVSPNCETTVTMSFGVSNAFSLSILKTELVAAVKQERYEDAAKIRDRIAELEKQIEQ